MTDPAAPDEPRARSLPLGLLAIAVVIGFGLGFKLGRASALLEQPGPVPAEVDETGVTPAAPTGPATPTAPDDSVRTQVEPPQAPPAEPGQPATALDPGSPAAPGPAPDAPASDTADRSVTVRLLGFEDAASPEELVLRVRDPANGDVLGSNLQLSPETALPGTSPAAFLVTGLPPGEWVVMLLHRSDWGHHPDPIGQVPVDLRAGDATVELALPQLYTLEVLAPDMEVGKALFLDLTADLGHRSFGKYDAVVDADHVARFEGLAPGAYTLHGGGPLLELELPRGPIVYGE